MRIVIAATGRLKAGPERELFSRYFGRAGSAGRRLGINVELRELPESRAAEAVIRRERETAALIAALAPHSTLVALDEGGRSLDSRALAARIAAWRDAGVGTLAFAIGGPDGLDPAIFDRAALRLALGALTWPHQLARVMLAEQLYRAVTLLSGHPYHRD